MERKDKAYFIKQISDIVSNRLDFFTYGEESDKYCIVFQFPLKGIVAIDRTLRLYTLGNGTDNAFKCCEQDNSTLMMLNSILDLSNKDNISPCSVKSLEWLETHNNDKVYDLRKHWWDDTPILENKNGSEVCEVSSKFRYEEVYGLLEFYQECDKQGRKVGDLFREIISPFSDNETIAKHLVKYLWKLFDIGNFRSSILIKPEYIELYVGNIDRFLSNCSRALNDIIEKHPSLYTGKVCYDANINCPSEIVSIQLFFTDKISKKLNEMQRNFNLINPSIQV